MIGKILAIADEDGKIIVDNAKDIWLRQGYELDEASIADVMQTCDFRGYYMIAMVMNNANEEMFTSCMRLLKSITQVPIVMFPVSPVSPEYESMTLYEGADRVLPLPMEAEKAIANCEAVIRGYLSKVKQDPALPIQSEFLECEGLKLVLDTRTAMINGKDVPLTAQEFLLLRAFLVNKNQTLTYQQLYRLVWGDDDIGLHPKIVSNLVSRLWSKIKTSGSRPFYIKSIYEVGYKFICNVISNINP